MKLIEQSVENWTPVNYELQDIYNIIEKAARICYKSEAKSTGDSKAFVKKLINMQHYSMLEHGTVYLKMFWPGTVCTYCNQTLEDEHLDKYLTNPYSKVVYHGNDVFITTNYRVMVENGWLDDLRYLCKPTEFHKKRVTFKLITSISLTRELIRHRAFSFANESTRFINYNKKGEFYFIQPYWLSSVDEKSRDTFLDVCTQSAQSYLQLINNGCSPQEAREVLPLCTKSELVMTGFEDDWKHFLDLRLKGTTGAPHPDMLILAKEIYSTLFNINL